VSDEYAKIRERFERETADHEMTVLLDQGLYRHVRFSAKGSLDWFDLITWPYNLIVNGSHGSYHFCRFGPDTEDMFVLFRDSGCGRDINPEYWAEKVRAGEVESWSETKFRDWLAKTAADLETRYPGIAEAVNAQVLHSDEHSTEYEETARYALACFDYDGVRLRIPEPWEQETQGLTFEDFDGKYLWQCFAIVWGIARWDARDGGAS
jgi:hypothetical protein